MLQFSGAERSSLSSSLLQVTPDWDLDQLEVILEEPSSWQLVVAGPGAGKSAVACQRIANLIHEGIPPSRMLLVSFTRTAVAELRDRIANYAVASDQARSVRISTIDSHAWSLRAGFDDEPIAKTLGDGSFDLSISRTVELFRQKQPDLCDFISRVEHLIIDEAQDVMGVRADLIVELLRNLSAECGVTILADPAQAIYGFTADGEDQNPGTASLLSRLATESPRDLLQRELKEIHRIENGSLLDLFMHTRREIEQAEAPAEHVARVQDAIRSTCSKDVGATRFPKIADFLVREGNASMLVLFRRRADVLIASSYCSKAGVQHRLRMSGLPVVVRPWIGWLFGDYVDMFITREAFGELWEARSAVAPEPFVGEDEDECWDLLHRLAAGGRSGTIDMVQLRKSVSRPRPPVEVCYPEVGTAGPILGTIHASKGREADSVVLVMPPSSNTAGADSRCRDSAMAFEEGRVYYVGATRARKMLIAAGNSSARVGYLESGRVYRNVRDRQVQVEVGRASDIDRTAHLAWSKRLDSQRALAACVGRTLPVTARTSAEHDYSGRLILQQTDSDGVTRPREVGQMSLSFSRDLGTLWGKIDSEQKLRPAPEMRHLYLVAVSTVGLSESETEAVRPPFNRSGLALAPVVKGFPMVPFFIRQIRRDRRYE